MPSYRPADLPQALLQRAYIRNRTQGALTEATSNAMQTTQDAIISKSMYAVVL